jgi:hypothetical protein
MRCSRFVPLVAGLLFAESGPAHGQHPRPLSAILPLQFEPWRAAAPLDSSSQLPVGRLAATSRDRKRQALVGGAIGAATGVVFCTAVSTLANDSAEGGLSFCPLDSYLLLGGAGFVLGAAIGWVI